MKEINSLKFCYELISFIKTQTVIVTDYYTLFNNDGSTIMEYFFIKTKNPTHTLISITSIQFKYIAYFQDD